GRSEQQRRAYTLADNRLAETSEWDDELLNIELTFLSDAGFDLDLTGFDEKTIGRLLDFAGNDCEATRTKFPRFHRPRSPSPATCGASATTASSAATAPTPRRWPRCSGMRSRT